jgi:branched-chain amino acid transport system substrate-binding protein
MQPITSKSNSKNISQISNSLESETTSCSRRHLLKASACALFCTLYPLQDANAIPSDNNVIRLGQSAPITGPMARVGLAFRDAALAVFNEVNSQGGIGGKKLELITLDDENRFERTELNAKLLATEHHVIALFGFLGAGAHRAGARAAATEGLPYIAAVSGGKELRSGNLPRIFNMRASHEDEIESVVRHIHQIGMERISVIFEYNSDGWEIRDALIASLKLQGQKSASLSSIDHEGSDFNLQSAVATILAGNPQAILLGADFLASSRFVAASRKAGFTGSFYTLSTVGGTALIEALGPLAPGLSVTQVVPFPWTLSTKIGRDFQAFCKRNTIEPSFASMEAYLASNLVVTALKRMRESTPASLTAVLESFPTQDFGGYQGTLYSKSRRTPEQIDLTVFSRSGKFLK